MPEKHLNSGTHKDFTPKQGKVQGVHTCEIPRVNAHGVEGASRPPRGDRRHAHRRLAVPCRGRPAGAARTGLKATTTLPLVVSENG